MRLQALIRVTSRCNNRCVFCRFQGGGFLNGGLFGEPTEDAVAQAIDEAAHMGLQGVVLSGGEATTRRELPRWILHASRQGLQVGLVTNGRVLSQEWVVDRLRALGLREVCISLHGPPAIHDAITRAPSFSETLSGVEHAVQRGLWTTVVCVVTRQNVEHLQDVVDRVVACKPHGVIFSLLEPEGEALPEDVPEIEHAAARVGQAITHGQRMCGDGRPTFAHAGLPHCLVAGFEDAFVDRLAEGLVMEWNSAKGWMPLEARDRVYPEACTDCPRPGRCPGLSRKLVERREAPRLVPPPPVPRANSFTYEPWADLGPWSPKEPCPARARPGLHRLRARGLLMAPHGKLLLALALTRDFSDAALLRTKFWIGQVYADISGKPAPTDFAKDLRALRLVERCRVCPDKEQCAGQWEIVDEDVFSKDDTRVREIIAGLRGRVLDVGCGGDLRYQDVLEPLVKSGKVEYLGVDPDPTVVASFQGHPWARVQQGTLEELAVGGGWDFLLLLRALNHLRDVAKALDSAWNALKPGGQLVVADNVPFGLVRLMPVTSHGPEPRHEHYRNLASQEAAVLIERRGFRLLEHRPVKWGTSDQWLLRFERPRGEP